MPAYVEVAINLPQISDTYHYHLPDDLHGEVQAGSLVIVPFGRQRVQGVVVRFVTTPDVPDTRPVEDLVDADPALTPAQLALADWLAEETLAPLGACLSLMLPTGLSQRTDTLITLNPDQVRETLTFSPLEKRIVGLLQKRGALRGRQVDAALRQVDWRGTLRKLAREGVVTTRAILPPPRVRAKTVRKVTLAIDPDALPQHTESLSRVQRVHERRLRVLTLLAQEANPVEPSWIYAQTGGNYGDLKMLSDANLIRFLNTEVWRDPLEETAFVPATPPELTRDQTAAWKVLESGLTASNQGDAPPPFLLHGVTGSGKTELYLRAVQAALNAGKQAIILVPEISLTPQAVKRFLARFPDQVGVVHSQLSEGERYDTWRRARQGELPVIVGPRSALFMPMENLGLIVVDECHHDSYAQQDSLPFYHAAASAVAYARLSGAAIILGSATPKITQFYQTVRGNWTYVALPRRILAHRDAITQYTQRLGIDFPVHAGEGAAADLGLPRVSIVDMRQELRDENRSILSRELHASLQEALDAHQQAILFLNRRGSATYVFCRDCGYVVRCPRDDKPLTFHQPPGRLLCHTCGYQRQVPARCPECGSRRIRQLGTGTEKVEEIVQEAFPQARTLRWDAETTRKKGAHEAILTRFTHHQADILIGTQMLAKGLDLPLVTLVGVILAEVGLNLPDYRASERSFQVLTQVAGRAGRSPLGGRVIIQTYQPENYVIQTAARHDYMGFYEQEMAYRRDLRYPPYVRLVRLEYRHHDPRKVEQVARELADNLREWIEKESPATEMVGPVPCFFSKSYGRYRWQIILKGPDPRTLLRDRQLPDWIIEVDPPSLL